jgi:hypothetical protein
MLVLIGSALFAASQLYYMREMFAALILFSVLFSAVAAVLLILFLLDRAGEAAISFLEMHARELLQHVRDWRTGSYHAPS